MADITAVKKHLRRPIVLIGLAWIGMVALGLLLSGFALLAHDITRAAQIAITATTWGTIITGMAVAWYSQISLDDYPNRKPGLKTFGVVGGLLGLVVTGDVLFWVGILDKKFVPSLGEMMIANTDVFLGVGAAVLGVVLIVVFLATRSSKQEQEPKNTVPPVLHVADGNKDQKDGPKNALDPLLVKEASVGMTKRGALVAAPVGGEGSLPPAYSAATAPRSTVAPEARYAEQQAEQTQALQGEIAALQRRNEALERELAELRNSVIPPQPEPAPTPSRAPSPVAFFPPPAPVIPAPSPEAPLTQLLRA